MQIRGIQFFKRIFNRKTKDIPVPCQADQPEEEYGPMAGQRGKDVEWVPCSPVVMNKMFEMANVTPRDYLIDLGSGDGRMVIGAARLGAQALGVEYNPRMVELSRKNAAKEGLNDRAIFIEGNFFETDISRATIIALFLRKDINIALRPKILDLKPGTRVISNIFDMGEWQADEVVKVEDENYYFKNHTVYFWVVPAKIAGVWKFTRGELILEQIFQNITGILRLGNEAIPVTGKITGGRIDFIAGDKKYTGRFIENILEMDAAEGEIGWTAVRG